MSENLRLDRNRWCRSWTGLLHWNVLWLMALTVGIGIVLFVMPRNLDDYWFVKEMRWWFVQQDILETDGGGDVLRYGFPWHDILKEIEFRVTIDNARLGNILVLPFLFLPKWVGMVPVMLSWLYIMRSSFRLSRVDWRTSPMVPAAVFLWTFFIPWRDSMTSVVFAFNYIIPCALACALLMSLFHGHGRRLIKVVLLGFLTGWWHEAFGLPIAAGLLTLVLVDRRWRNRLTFSALAALVTGTLMIVCAPSFGVRTGSTVNVYISEILRKMPAVMVMTAPYWLYVCIFVFRLIRRKAMREKALLVMMVVSGAVPVIITLVTYTQSRIMFWTECAAVIGLMTLFGRWKPFGSIRAGLVKGVMAALALLASIHLAYADYFTFRIRHEYMSALAQYRQNPESAAFVDVINSQTLPMIVLNMPDVLMFNSDMYQFNAYLDSDEPKLHVVPRELRRATMETGEAIGGNMEARVLNGRLYTPVPEGLEVPMHGMASEFDADFGDGYKKYSIWFVSFRSEADGRDYVYVHIYTSWYNNHFRRLRGFRYRYK